MKGSGLEMVGLIFLVLLLMFSVIGAIILLVTCDQQGQELERWRNWATLGIEKGYVTYKDENYLSKIKDAQVIGVNGYEWRDNDE